MLYQPVTFDGIVKLYGVKSTSRPWPVGQDETAFKSPALTVCIT